MEGLHFSSTFNTASQVSCSAVRGVTIKIREHTIQHIDMDDGFLSLDVDSYMAQDKCIQYVCLQQSVY